MINLKENGEILVLGERFNLTYSKLTTIKPLLRFSTNEIIIYKGINSNSHREVLIEELRKKAKIYLIKRCLTLSKKVGVPINKISVRNQSTRWGSCSSNKNINLNWKLYLLPENVSDYVIYHELAHIIEMNHSKRFWNVVEKMDSNWRKNREILREFEKELSFKIKLD